LGSRTFSCEWSQCLFIGQVRAKIERDPTDPKIIRTEPGVGYRFAIE
jgi:DNA-binding response OmpR family regulator